MVGADIRWSFHPTHDRLQEIWIQVPALLRSASWVHVDHLPSHHSSFDQYTRGTNLRQVNELYSLIAMLFALFLFANAFVFFRAKQASKEDKEDTTRV